MNGACNGTFFDPPPKALAKMSNVKFQVQSQFQRVINQTLYVLSQIKDIKHIKRDFHLVTWAMPQSGTWCDGVQRFNFSKQGHVSYQIKGDDE